MSRTNLPRYVLCLQALGSGYCTTCFFAPKAARCANRELVQIKFSADAREQAGITVCDAACRFSLRRRQQSANPRPKHSRTGRARIDAQKKNMPGVNDLVHAGCRRGHCLWLTCWVNPCWHFEKISTECSRRPRRHWIQDSRRKGKCGGDQSCWF